MYTRSSERAAGSPRPWSSLKEAASKGDPQALLVPRDEVRQLSQLRLERLLVGKQGIRHRSDFA